MVSIGAREGNTPNVSPYLPHPGLGRVFLCATPSLLQDTIPDKLVSIPRRTGNRMQKHSGIQQAAVFYVLASSLTAQYLNSGIFP